MKQVLIVTDDAHTKAWLSQALDKLNVRLGFSAVNELRSRLKAEPWDLLVIDPERELDAAVTQVDERADTSNLAVLLVIQPDALPRLRFPSAAKSDFFVRGASSEELVARARTLLWPGEDIREDEVVRIDDLTVNLATYQAYIGRRSIDFAYLEYALFAFLVTHPGRTYSREALLQRVWGTDYYGGSRTVDVHIRRIRAKIGPELSRRLQTVRNVGYLWQP